MAAWVVAAVLGACVSACAGGLAPPDASLFATPARDAITFWGHACCYIDVGGVGVVTDPVFDHGIPLRHRLVGAPPPSAYAGARVILISHAHPDHLSPETLRSFPREAVVLCPAPSAEYLRDTGLQAQVMAPGDEFSFAGGKIRAVAAHHMGTRWGVSARTDGRALGYVIETATTTVFYSGDTNYFSGFSDVGWTFSPDIVLLNVNGHLHSDDASRAAWATRAPIVIPIHWGVFGYWVFGGNKRPHGEKALTRLSGERLRVLEIGQSIPLGAGVPGHPARP